MGHLILIIFSLLMFILSIDGTIALRNILVFSLFISLIYVNKKIYIDIIKTYEDISSFKIIVRLLVIFAAYIFLHSIFISMEPTWSLSEFKSHIFYPIIYFLIGILLANYIQNSTKFSKETLITVLFYSLFIHIFYLDLYAIEYLFNRGVLLVRFGGLTDSPVNSNYLTNILLAMIIAEFVYRLRTKKQILKLDNIVLYFFLIACIFSTFVEGLRLGNIALVFLGVSSCMAFLYKNHEYSSKIKSFIALGFLLILSIPLIYNIITDKRWSNLVETIPASIILSEDPSFINPNAPVLITKSGLKLQGSNYLRVTYLVNSLKYISEDPIGIGFGRNAFGHALELRYPEYPRRGLHAHSSIMELSLGAGIIATMIWLSFVYAISKPAIIKYKKSLNYYALLSLFLTLGFVSRSLVDANMRDHMFLQFMIMLGISLFFMFLDKSKLSN